MKIPTHLDKSSATLIASLNKQDPSMTPADLRSKIQEDMRFLEDRIDSAKQARQQHSPVTQTYWTMLAARKRVLAWLDLEHPETTLRSVAG